MAWFKVDQSVFTHIKTMMCAEALGIRELYVVAHLASLWSWSIDYAPDGILPSSVFVIAKAAGWVGDADLFTSALVGASFIDKEGDQLRIHGWDEYAKPLIDRREYDKIRKKALRESDSRRMSAGCPQDVRRMSDRKSQSQSTDSEREDQKNNNVNGSQLRSSTPPMAGPDWRGAKEPLSATPPTPTAQRVVDPPSGNPIPNEQLSLIPVTALPVNHHPEETEEEPQTSSCHKSAEVLSLCESGPEGTAAETKSKRTPIDRSADIEAVWSAWITSAKKNKSTVLDKKRRDCILKALKSFPVADVVEAVQGWEFSDFHRGKNDRRKIYNELTLLLRDASKIEGFRDLTRKSRAAAPIPLSAAEVERRARIAAENAAEDERMAKRYKAEMEAGQLRLAKMAADRAARAVSGIPGGISDPAFAYRTATA